MFNSDDESSDNGFYKPRSQQRNIPEHVKKQQEIFNEFFSKKTTPHKEINLQNEFNLSSSIKFQRTFDKNSTVKIDKQFNQSGKPPSNISQSLLNRKSLERFEHNYLNSNYLKHIESKLRMDLAEKQGAVTLRNKRDQNPINQHSFKIPQTSSKNSAIKISPQKPQATSQQIKQNQTHRNYTKNLSYNQQLIQTPQQQTDFLNKRQDKPPITFQQLQDKFKEKNAPQLTTRVDINNSRIREKKLKKSKINKRKTEQLEDPDLEVVLKRKQRSQSFKQKQVDRYQLQITNEEEADDDNCNISDDQSDQECPVNKNQQRKYEIERFVFKMSDSQKHIETSHTWFQGLKSHDSNYSSQINGFKYENTPQNSIQQKKQSLPLQRQIDELNINSQQTASQITNKLQQSKRKLNKDANKSDYTNFSQLKISMNCNSSIVTTKRAPQNSNILRQSYKDDPDSLMPVESMEDTQDDIKKVELNQSIGKTTVQQKETQASLNNQSLLNYETPSQKQEKPPINSRQRQLQQVSRYLKQYQQNLNSKKRQGQSIDIDQKINIIGSQINNRILKMLMTKEDFREPSTLKQIRQLLLAGISNDVRRKLWASLINAKELKQQFPRSQFRKQYLNYNKCWALTDIKRDVKRTFQSIYYFKVPEQDDNYDYTRNPLTNILVSYANYDEELSYAQGMNYIGSLFFMVFQDEYESFLAMHYVMQTLDWRSIYLNNTLKLQNLILNVQKKLYKEIPLVYKHMQDKNVTNSYENNAFIIQILPMSVYSQLYLAIGLYNCQIDHAYQIMDLFLLEGESVLLKLIINSVKLKQKKILAYKEDFELAVYLQQNLLQECLKEYGLKGILEEGP